MHNCPACHAPVSEHAVRCDGCGSPQPARGPGAVQHDSKLSAGAWSQIVRLCGWCSSGTRDVHATGCVACGGALPPLPPRILAELALPTPEVPYPPETPRKFPPGYAYRVRYSNNVGVLLGALFTVVFCWTIMFPIIGIPLWYFGHRRAERQLRALQVGRAVEGTITKVFLDTSQHINKKHPWQIDYRFETPTGPATGSVTSWDPMTERREAGERVWVVYDQAADHTASSLWPPVG